MNVRLQPDEVRQAIREYLSRRGIDVDVKNDIQFSYYVSGKAIDNGSIITDIVGIEQKVKVGGPYREE